MHYESRKYRRLIEWISMNDNDGEADPIEQLAGYLTVKLVADCYDLTCRQVAEDVFAIRAAPTGAEEGRP